MIYRVIKISQAFLGKEGGGRKRLFGWLVAVVGVVTKFGFKTKDFYRNKQLGLIFEAR